MYQAPHRVVFVGEIDHGKSSLIGRLLLDTGSLNDAQVGALDGGASLASITDSLDEEQTDAISIDTCQVRASINGNPYLFIDAPGHLGFLKNMVTGATFADTGVMVIAADAGVQPQTKLHAEILCLLGIKTVVVVVNKMDTRDGSAATFDEVSEETRLLFGRTDIRVVSVIPASALDGSNVFQRSSSWYEGPTLCESLESIGRTSASFGGTRFLVQGNYKHNGISYSLGRMISDNIDILVHLFDLTGNEYEVLKTNDFPVSSGARNGRESVALLIHPPPPTRSVLFSGGHPSVISTVHVRVCAFEDLIQGDRVQLRCSVQTAGSVVLKIDQVYPAERPDDKLEKHSIGTVHLLLDESILLESSPNMPQLKRMVLERDGRLIAAGLLETH